MLRHGCKRSPSPAGSASRRRCEHAGSRVAAAFTDAGAQQLKNIAEPVHVFRVAASPAAQVIAAPVPLSLPDKPSVAVLPFTNMSADPVQEFFADGSAEDVITA